MNELCSAGFSAKPSMLASKGLSRKEIRVTTCSNLVEGAFQVAFNRKRWLECLMSTSLS